MEEVYKAAVEALQAGEIACVATIVSVKGSTPRGVGAKMLIRADGTIVGTIGGGAMEARIIGDARKAIASGESGLFDYSLRGETGEDLAICGGEAQVFLETLSPRRELVIVGGGHIALYLARFGPLLGFRTVIIDDRQEFANGERFPTADRTIVALPEAVAEVVDIDERTCVVIATRGHGHDEQALRAVLDSSAGYVGLVGSRHKVETVFEHLQEAGASDEALARVYTPVGLDIGSDTPAEIALSIMAEIIMVERKGSGRPLRERGNPILMRQRAAHV